MNDFRPYCVQYEIEYEDRNSENDVFVLYARSESEAWKVFDRYYAHTLFEDWVESGITGISANAVWLD